jgi:hypothetical protein
MTEAVDGRNYLPMASDTTGQMTRCLAEFDTLRKRAEAAEAMLRGVASWDSHDCTTEDGE